MRDPCTGSGIGPLPLLSYPIPWQIIYIKYLDFSAHEICQSSPIYLFAYLFVSVLTHRYFVYTLGYSPILRYLFCWSNCSSLVFGDSSIWLLSLFDKPIYVGIFFLSEHFLLAGTRRCSTLTLWISCPRSRISISPWSPHLFFPLRNWDLSAACAYCYQDDMVSRLSQLTARKYMCAY